MKTLNGETAQWEVRYADGSEIEDHEFGRRGHLFATRAEADAFADEWRSNPEYADSPIKVVEVED